MISILGQEAFHNKMLGKSTQSSLLWTGHDCVI